MKEQRCNTIKETLAGNQETWDSQLHCILIAKEDTNSFGVIFFSETSESDLGSNTNSNTY